MENKKIKINHDEIWPVLNILNEICNGFYINNFEKTIGAKEQNVRNLKRELTEFENSNTNVLILNELDIDIINNAFNAVFKEIEEWEFQTRIGISVNEALELKRRLT